MEYSKAAVNKMAELVLLFLFGGTGYGICELVWRGYTHFSMVILGGICFCVIFFANKKFHVLSFVERCFFSGIFITSMELLCGCIVNIAFDMKVWDYSMLPFNFLGQVCLYFSILWVLLSAPVLIICRLLRKYFG